MAPKTLDSSETRAGSKSAPQPGHTGMHAAHSAYRPEIDGLRAVAVVPVILFHAGIPGFSGGFVGVDVFFVISGYLITGIIWGEILAGRFSMARFFERRARRLLPALLIMLVVTTLAAWAWMTPDDLAQYSWSVVSVLTVTANLWFWQSTDYFSAPAELLPLLHTWSLAIEEQFYLIFPLLLLMLATRARVWTPLVLTLAAVVSLALCLWLALRGGPMTANFYLPVTRFWELLAGAVLVLVQKQRTDNTFAALLGLTLIVGSIILLDADTIYPSAATLLPVVGTLLLLAYAGPTTWVGRSLSFGPMVGIGLISYSAYLWHQPLMAFGRLRFDMGENLWAMGGLALASVGVAALSWHYVEMPIRKRRGWPGQSLRASLTLGASVAALVLAVNMYGGLSHGVPNRYTPAQQALLQDGNSFHALLQTEAHWPCFLNTGNGVEKLVDNDCLTPRTMDPLIVFGNSHAAHLAYGFAHVLDETEVLLFSAGNCRPWIDARTPPRCVGFHEHFLSALPDLPPSRVVVAANWHWAYWELGEGVFETHIRTLLADLSAQRHQVLLVGRGPSFANGAWQAQIARMRDVPRDFNFLTHDTGPVNTLLAELAQAQGVAFFDPSRSLCDAPDGLCQVIDNGVLLFADSGHFSVEGSRRVVTDLMQAWAEQTPEAFLHGTAQP